jgi:anti-sigma factor RsiW
MATDAASAATARPPHVGRLLGAYVLGVMEPVEARRVREHLAACPLCAREHAALTRTVGLLRRYETPPDDRDG